ncbi:MAG: hypothetical protein IIB33_03965, partial [Chloroflexi bacterium]|nr:hypothetical protein [Chloroflexota bacterium]
MSDVLYWEDVEEASEADVDAYPVARLIRAKNDPKVYFITDNGFLFDNNSSEEGASVVMAVLAGSPPAIITAANSFEPILTPPSKIPCKLLIIP